MCVMVSQGHISTTGVSNRMWVRIPAVTLVSARHLIIIASLHPGVKWVPVRAELVDEHRPCAVMAAIELYTPQGAEMVSGMMYEPYEQGVIMRLEHHLVGGYVRYISPYIIIIIIITVGEVADYNAW